MIFQKIFSLFKRLFKQNRVDYVYGAPLPKPLSKEEECELVRRYKEGDEGARKELIERNLRLVVYIAKKFEGSVPDNSELISIGAMGLIKAVNSFNPDKNIKLATFASRCIENEILMYLRKVSKRRLEVSLDEPINTDWEGNELLLGDVIGTEPDQINQDLERKNEIEYLYQSLARLSDREKLILRLRYGLGNVEERTQKEIADMLGISQSYISRLEKKLLVKLRKDLGKYIN